MSADPPQHQFLSPLRYPGGKRKVANFMKLLFLHNGLVGREYYEVYAGGASVALALLYGKYASHVYINDLDRSVWAFWKAVLDDTDRLCGLITGAHVTMDEWRRQRDVQSAADPDILDLAFSTFFLNRTNRSGIIRGGVIGGKGQLGKWGLDARYNRADLVSRINKVARHRAAITLSRTDAAEFLRSKLHAASPAASVAYLDPPYFIKGGGLYENSYQPEDHARIAKAVRKLRCAWVVSYDAIREIRSLYRGFSSIEYDLSYSAQERYRGEEVMFSAPT